MYCDAVCTFNVDLHYTTHLQLYATPATSLTLLGRYLNTNWEYIECRKLHTLMLKWSYLSTGFDVYQGCKDSVWI